MIFSMCGLMMKLKWCAWIALYCSCISFANSRASDDAKQVFGSMSTNLTQMKLIKSFLGIVFIYAECQCSCHVIPSKSSPNDTTVGFTLSCKIDQIKGYPTHKCTHLGSEIVSFKWELIEFIEFIE